MTLIEDLYHQNEWATLRLLEACRGLSEEQLEADAPGTFGSIRRTLLHLVGADPSYVTRIGGTYEGPAVQYDGPLDLDLLAQVTQRSTVGLIERAERSLEGSWTFTSPEGEEIDAEVVLAQALNHATEHRAHVCTILTTLGIEPPELDAWAWAEETGRARMP